MRGFVVISRDDPNRVGTYLKEHFPEFQGLTGTPEQVRKAAKSYRVYYSKDNSEGDDYLVDHSIITYLMGPDGKFLEHYTRSVTAEDMALRIAKSVSLVRE
mmetsp:Transcript_2944/g.5586  ORF Transcript_2944/g.5586 Transcript_2944/m.5586 type:complete len:101 (+) Transcript_2944:552-854(+)